MLADAKGRLLRIPGEEGAVAEAALRRRAIWKPQQVARQPSLQGVVGLGPGSPLGTYGHAATALGGWLAEEGGERADWVLCSLSHRPAGP